MNMKEFTEYERIQQALNKSIPVTAVQYDPDIIGAIIGQAELLCRGTPSIDPSRMDGIYTTTGGVALKLSALRYLTEGSHSFRSRGSKRSLPTQTLWRR